MLKLKTNPYGEQTIPFTCGGPARAIHTTVQIQQLKHYTRLLLERIGHGKLTVNTGIGSEVDLLAVHSLGWLYLNTLRGVEGKCLVRMRQPHF